MPQRIKGPCIVTGCPRRATHQGRCIEHKQTTSQRDYGSDHQRQRAQWQRLIDQGNVKCRRCDQPIPPRDPSVWDLGHPTPKAPECRACNRGTMGRDRA